MPSPPRWATSRWKSLKLLSLRPFLLAFRVHGHPRDHDSDGELGVRSSHRTILLLREQSNQALPWSFAARCGKMEWAEYRGRPPSYVLKLDQ
ncbi:hypothetical protein V2W45_404586 [Cenococcum geophilum]